MLAALLKGLLPDLGNILERYIPSPVERERAQQEMTLAMANREADLQKAAADIVKTEAASEHWLTATWRPIVMLVFTALIVARWFGWSAPGIGEPEALKLWSIVEFGLGGYVVGRSAEKIVPQIVQAVRK